VRWRCNRCGEEHVGLPHDWAYDSPVYWDGGRAADDFLTEDLCRWTDDDGKPGYFIRGVLSIPVRGGRDDFRYGIWSSLSEQSFERVVELWEDPSRIAESPYFGWLSNSIPGYPETLNLPLDVVTDELNLRPRLVLHPGEHPLVREQREGIPVARVRELAELNLHPV
jgi:hypothetical protein